MEESLKIVIIYCLSVIGGGLTIRFYNYLISKRKTNRVPKYKNTRVPKYKNTPPKRPKKSKILYLVIHRSSNRVIRIYEKESKAIKYIEKQMKIDRQIVFRIESFKIK